MKILQIAPPWIGIPPRDYGGTEWVIANLVEELVKKGHDVTLFGTGNSQVKAKLKYVYETGLFEQNDQQWLLDQPALALPALVHYDQAFKEAETGNYDVVHAHLSAGTDLMKLKFLSELSVPYIATTHMVFPFDKWSNKDEEYIKYYANDVRLVFISKTQAKLYPNNFQKLGVVYNSLNLDTMQFTATPKGHDGEPYLTWLGKIMPWKGLDVAIDVATQLGMRLIFAGVLDETNHPESQIYFKERIEPRIDGDRVQFIGAADLQTKNHLLGNATAFLNPISWAEPFGMVVLEAMATGTPVISFGQGGPLEIIEDGKSGFIVHSTAEMAQAIKRIGEIDRRKCRQLVEQRFSSRTMADSYIKLYQKTMASNGADRELMRHALLRSQAMTMSKKLTVRPAKELKKLKIRN